MNYKIFDVIYQANKELDKMFDDTFSDSEMYKKNKLELLVEIGELANETRYFKYWSNKPSDINLVRGEYADCIIMTFYFFNVLNISLSEDFLKIKKYNKIDIFGRLYKLASDFYYNDDKKIIKEILSTLISLGYMIGFNDNDIIDLCLEKINKDKARF